MTTSILEKIYLDVVVFERRVRAVFGAEFTAHISDEKREEFLSRFTDLIGEESSAAKLAYVKLVDEVLADIGTKFPVRDLHVLWPNGEATREKAALLSDENCNCLARISERASRLLPTSRFRPNKFQF